jgi:hypothetical protein
MSLGVVRLESGTFESQAATMDKTIVMDFAHLLEFFKHNFSKTDSFSVIRCKGEYFSTRLSPSDLVFEETEDDWQYLENHSRVNCNTTSSQIFIFILGYYANHYNSGRCSNICIILLIAGVQPVSNTSHVLNTSRGVTSPRNYDNHIYFFVFFVSEVKTSLVYIRQMETGSKL